MWIHSFGAKYNTLKINDRYDESPADIPTSEYRYSMIFRKKIGDSLDGTVGGTLTSNSQGHTLSLRDESLFYSGFLLFSKSFENGTNSKWYFGLVIPDRAAGLPIIPGLGLDFETVDKHMQFQLAFPTSAVTYFINEDFRVGVFVSYERKGYSLLDSDVFRNLHGESEYLATRRILVGTYSKHALGSGFWLTLRLAVPTYAKTELDNNEFERVLSLDEDSGVYFSTLLGYRFD